MKWLLPVVLALLLAGLGYLFFFEGGLNAPLSHADERDPLPAMIQETRAQQAVVLADLKAGTPPNLAVLSKHIQTAQEAAVEFPSRAGSFDALAAWNELLLEAAQRRIQFQRQLRSVSSAEFRSLKKGDEEETRAFAVQDVHTQWRRYVESVRPRCEDFNQRVVSAR